MKLYLLQRKHDDADFDEAEGFVVRAQSPTAARKIAADFAGDEGGDFWKNAALSSCEELRDEGEPGLVLRDFNAG